MDPFKKKLLIFSRLLALFLILAIIYIGYIQYKYAAEITEIRNNMGSLGYCYLCGLEAARKCECQYFNEVLNAEERERIREQTAEYNIQTCQPIEK